MMEKFFSFMSFYEQHQQAAPAQSNNIDNNYAVTPMSLDSSSYARENKQQPNFAPYEPQRGSISFMPHQQPSPGQEDTGRASEAFVTIVITGLSPHWRSTRAILRAHGKISEAALCAEIHAEQQDMDLYEERHKKRATNERVSDNPTNIDSSRDNIGSSRDNISSSRDNIGNSRDNIGSSRDNTGSSRGNTDYNTNRGSFNGTSSHRRYSTDSCTAVDSHSTRSSQKRQPHRGILL
ncbi:unnamed protein product [Closterium sp. NIES-54]